MSNRLEELVEVARAHRMTDEEKQEQRRSFAFGNAAIENELVTREMIDEQDELLKAQ